MRYKLMLFRFIRWLAIANLLLWLVQRTHAWPFQILAYLVISILPGAILLWTFRVRIRSYTEGLLFSFGLGLLVLMLGGLAVNEFLYLFGIHRPLELIGVWAGWNAAIIICLIFGSLRRKIWELPAPTGYPITNFKIIFAGLAACLPVLATFGAFRLNNGGNAVFVMVTLGLIALLLVAAMLWQRRLGDATLLWLIFMMGLAILLMTSLRSWDISGHDIMREFHVYTLTHVNGRWNIGAYRDPYNACLSITILPEIYTRLLHLSGLTVFKFILQIPFALCAAVIYQLLRRYVSKVGAIVGYTLFLSYPTFINDSAMMARQGVAYLFFALALLAILPLFKGKNLSPNPSPGPKSLEDGHNLPELRQHSHSYASSARKDSAPSSSNFVQKEGLGIGSERIQKQLFILCSLGIIVSHYSTTYMFIGIFAVALLSKVIIKLVLRQPLELRGKTTVLTPGILALLAAITFLWYGQFTDTSGGLTLTLARSISNIPHLLSADNKSADASGALLLSAHKSQADLFQSYISHPKVVNKIVTALQYRPQLANDDLPLTPIGRHLVVAGISPSWITTFRQDFAKLLQLLAAISVLYFVVVIIFDGRKRARSAKLPFDLVCISLGGLVLLVLMVVLPTISINYGLLRAFQQALIFLLIPMVVLLTILTRRLRNWLKISLATTSMAGIFLIFSGFIAQLTGGVAGAFTMNNHGLYYGLYYTTATDLRTFSWMKSALPAKSDVHAAGFLKAQMHDPQYPFYKADILPTQKPADTYAYLDQAQVVSQKFYVYHNSDPLILTFPIDYYQDWVDEVYSTTTTGVYR